MAEARNRTTGQIYDESQARVAALEEVLRDREAELLELKGPCSNSYCGLHSAHRGPCGPGREKR